MRDTTQNADAGKPLPDFAIIPRHIWLDRSLTNADRAVYDALASHCGGQDKRECWPGTETLVTISGVSAGTVSKSLAWLMHCGHVERWKGPRQMPDERQAVVTNYRLAWRNDSHADAKDRAVFFQMRHPSRREREFPSGEIPVGGNSTSGNAAISSSGKPDVSTQESARFPYGETHKNRPTEQTKLDQTRHNITHTAPTAASQTNGEWAVESGLDLPKPLLKIANGNRLWGDIRPRRWAQFVSEHQGQRFTTEALRERFRAWCKEHRVWEEADALGMREDAMSANTKEREVRREAHDKWPKMMTAQQAAPPQVHVIGNMRELPWVGKLSGFLETDDRHYEWLKWTLDNHDKRMTDIEAQKSWAKYASNRRQWLARREGAGDVPF